MNNTIKYVRTDCTHVGYIPTLKYSPEQDGFIATKDNYPFMQGRVFNDDEIEDIRAGRLLDKEVSRAAFSLELALEREAREILERYIIVHDNYIERFEFDDVTCAIIFTHEGNGVEIIFENVYFTRDGKILQYELKLR